MIGWLRALAPYHDYGWFIALLGWTVGALMWRRLTLERTGWEWLPWAAAGGALSALVEMASFAGMMEGARAWADLRVEDGLLSVGSGVMVAGWVSLLPARLGWRVIAMMLVLGVAGLRVVDPRVSSVALTLAGTLVAVAYMAGRPMSESARRGMGFALAALWLTSTGPVASLGLQPRWSVSLGEWSLVWSAAQAVAALVALSGVLAPWFAAGDRRREGKFFLWVCVSWLLVGMGLAAAMSAGARSNYEQQAVARTQIAAGLMNKADLEKLLGPEFQLTEIVKRERPGDGSVFWRARIPHLRTDAGAAVQKQLSLIGRASGNPGCFAWVLVPRDGWLAGITPQGYSNNPRNAEKRSDLSGLVTESAEDLIDWSERRAKFLPLIHEWIAGASTITTVRAPLRSADGRMLGWLLLEFPRTEWVVAQVQSRFQTFAIVGFGFGLAALAAVQRVRGREREAAHAAAEAAAQADRLKTAFLAKVSHELRTPIQSVLGYGELLQGCITDAVAARHLGALREHGGLMLRLVNDLLDLTAIQAGAFRLVEKPAALGDLTRRSVETLRFRAEDKGIMLNCRIDPAVPEWASLDIERTRQIILNLVGNAIKFTDAGKVDVTLEPGPGEQQVTLTVRDTGPGIAEEEIGLLFQPFSRLSRTAEKDGTGLGLALTAGLCRGMGGDISVESKIGEGTVFRAWVRLRPCVGAELTPIKPFKVSRYSGHRVLIADDNPLVRELFLATLGDAGVRCTAAEDGEQALAMAEAQVFDAIVLDLAMPKADGFEVVRRLRARGCTAKIVGVSAHAREEERALALAAGMDGFLVKPVQLWELLAAVVPSGVLTETRKETTDELLMRLRKEFRLEADRQGKILAAAVAMADFSTVRSRAHYMMNSAAVVRDDRLFNTCVEVEQAALAEDAARLAASWLACQAALDPWREPSAAK